MAFPMNPWDGRIYEVGKKAYIWTEIDKAWTRLPFTNSEILGLRELLKGTIKVCDIVTSTSTSISGLVTTDNAPTENITVNLYQSDGTTLIESLITDTEGNYQTSLLSTGIYIIQVDSQDSDLDPSAVLVGVDQYEVTIATSAIIDRDFTFTTTPEAVIISGNATITDI